MYIGEKWLSYRTTGAERFFTVHSVFSKFINLSTNQGLLSLATRNAGGSSSFLTVPGGRLDFDAEAGEQCVARAGWLHLADSTVNFENAALWKGPVSTSYRYTRIKDENIAAFKAVLDRKAAPHSAWRHIHSDAETRFRGLNVIKTLMHDPLEARNLIGLGQGLTPSGDDILLGFLAMVNHAPGNKAFLGSLRGVISGSLHKTTDISAQALANALNCDYHEYVQNCIRDLCEADKEAVYISAASLVDMGATSGSDIACGMYFGIRGM